MKTTMSMALELTTIARIRKIQRHLSAKINYKRVTMDMLFNAIMDTYESDNKEKKEE